MPDTTPAPIQAPVSSGERHKGRVLMQWQFPEYVQHERGKGWYILMIAIGIGLLWYAIANNNFLFAIILLLFALIVFTHHRTDPAMVTFTIYDTGVQIGDLFYLFRELQSFSVIYEPPVVKRLYIVPKKAVLRSEISIPLQEQNPLHIRAVLLDFVQEDLEREEESHTDQLGRMLKL